MKYKKLNEVLIEWNESSKEDSDNILINVNKKDLEISLDKVSSLSVDELQTLLDNYKKIPELRQDSNSVTWNVELKHWVPVEQRPNQRDRYSCSNEWIQLKNTIPENVKGKIVDNMRKLFYKKSGIPSRFELLYFLFHKQYLTKWIPEDCSNREVFVPFIFYYIISGINITINGTPYGSMQQYIHDMWINSDDYDYRYFDRQNIIKKMFQEALEEDYFFDDYVFPDDILVVHSPASRGIYKWYFDKYGNDIHTTSGFYIDLFEFFYPVNNERKEDMWHAEYYYHILKKWSINIFKFIRSYPL